jgi:hypothetical protein
MQSSIIPQIVFLLGLLVAIGIVLLSFRNQLFLSGIILALVLSKGLTGVSGEFEFLYVLSLNFIVASAAAISLNYPRVIYSQLMIVCTLSFVLMLLQVTGVGSWAQILTTHGPISSIQQDTLFVELQDLKYDVIQFRPAGLLHSNIVTSGVTLFAVALHFSQQRGGKTLGSLI